MNITDVVGWWTRRREPIHDHTAYPQEAGTPLPVAIYPQDAPQPVQYGRFWNVGRDPQHSGLTRDRRPEGLAIGDWLSVSAWPFLPGMKTSPSALILTQPTGFFNPQVTRVNIDAPEQTSLGMLTSLHVDTPSAVPTNYMKLV